VIDKILCWIMGHEIDVKCITVLHLGQRQVVTHYGCKRCKETWMEYMDLGKPHIKGVCV
jgi:hypothetical protein